LSTSGIIADALVRLARGQDVASVSPGIGYASASACAAMFRKALGQTRAIISLIEAVCSRHGSLRDIASLGT
jgi:AraC-like DNA-binding protein